MKKHKKWFIALGVFILLMIGGGCTLVSLLLDRPFRISGPTFLYIDNDDTMDSVCVKMEK